MIDKERQAFYRGVRSCIAWLHDRAREMNDPHAKAVLNSAAFDLGTEKPDSGPAEARSVILSAEELVEGWRPIETAPRDGTDVLLIGDEGFIASAGWLATENCWWGSRRPFPETPLGWTSRDLLPTPPKAEAE